jgi:translocator protein
MLKTLGIFLVFLCFCFLAAAGGAIAPPGEWYASIDKPSWNPPSYVFGPVWTALYIMIAIAGTRVWKARSNIWGNKAHKLWWLQWLLNALWTPVFFALHQMGWALAVILALWLSIMAFIAIVWREDKFSATLFIPYAMWVGFASFLNFTLWQLN